VANAPQLTAKISHAIGEQISQNGQLVLRSPPAWIATTVARCMALQSQMTPPFN
jgi:hypothetical protein